MWCFYINYLELMRQQIITSLVDPSQCPRGVIRLYVRNYIKDGGCY